MRAGTYCLTSSLTKLQLSFHEGLSDAGLAAAASLTQLQLLQPAQRCCRTSYTDAGIAMLRTALLANCDMLIPAPGLQRVYHPKNQHHFGDEVCELTACCTLT